jgi:hypothetical protein
VKEVGVAIPSEVRRIVLGKIGVLSEDERVSTPAGLEKPTWLKLLICLMRDEEGDAHKVVLAGAAEDYYRNLIEWFIRHTRVPVVDNLLSLEESLRQAKQANEVAQLRMPNGEYHAKRYIELTPLEADILAEQYARQSATLARKAAQLRADARQARLAGLADDEPFSTLLAA